MGIKVIFLDIDGVLNYGGCKERAPSGCIGIDDKNTKILAKIVQQTGAKIVLVSTWKFCWEKHYDQNMVKDAVYMDKQLARFGLTIFDKTYDHGFNRGEGIMNWINDTPEYIDSWIVIDDEFFPDYEKYNIAERLVKTSFGDEGLKEEHVEKAIQLLMDKP